MQVAVTLVIDVEQCDTAAARPPEADVLYSVREAVLNAIELAEENGFTHMLDGVIALHVARVGIAEKRA